MERKKPQYIKLRDAMELVAGSDYVGLKPSALRMKLVAIPTIDAVEVVRCRDCRHRSRYTHLLYCAKGVHMELRKPEDFCSYGEKEV